MKHSHSALLRCTAAAFALALSAVAAADGRREERYVAKLISYNETPAISSMATGTFTLVIDEAAQTMTYEVSYEGLEGPVQQSHIHFGQPFVTGGISLFLCTNLGNAPAGTTTPTCPASPGTVSGTLTAANIAGPNAQGIAPASAGLSPTEFAEIIRAIRTGNTYANVHSVKFPGGEIRGQLRRAGRDGHDD